jgi:hypothetical protein
MLPPPPRRSGPIRAHGRGDRNVHHEQARVPPGGPQGRRRHDGAAAARGDDSGPEGVCGSGGREEDPVRRHRDGARLGRQHAVRLEEEPVGARSDRQQLRPVADHPQPARAVPRRADYRQQHRRAQRRSVHRAGNRRRSLPVERGVPHPVAPEADAGLRPARRHLDRPDLREEVRPGHADPVDAAVHRERRPGGRLLLRLLLRLHRFDQLGVAGGSAADGARPARDLRPVVRRRRDAGRAQGAPRGGSQHPRLAGHLDRPAEEGPRRRRPRPPGRLSRRRARESSGGFRGSKRSTAAASSASCRGRRLACPTRSPSTSS